MLLCVVACEVANWGIPIAAFTDAQANPDKISGKMTTGKCLLLVRITTHRRYSCFYIDNTAKYHPSYCRL